MKLFVVEDEPEGLSRMLQLIKQLPMETEVVGTAGSIEESVNWLSQNPVDLILLDIELSDGQCFAIFDQIKVDAPVIFTTSYDEYSLQAFSVNSIDYLLKPVKLEELKAAVEKFKSVKGYYELQQSSIHDLLSKFNAENRYKDRFLVRKGSKFITISTEDIAYFYVEDRVTFAKLFSGSMNIVDYNLEELSVMLNPDQFRRINRSFLVNLKSIASVQNYFNGKLIVDVTPSCEKEVVVSRDSAMEFKIWLGK